MSAAILGAQVASVAGESTDLTNGMLAWYGCHEVTGSRFDSSGNGHTLTETAAIPSATGLFGGLAASFTNGGGYLFKATKFISSGPFSFSAWANTSGIGGGHLMDDGLNNGLFIMLTAVGGTPNTTFQFGATALNAVINNETPVLSQWQHYVGTHDGTTGKLYINGVLKVSGDIAATYASGLAFFSLGGSTIIDGLIQGVGVWNRAINQAEIDALYNSGTGMDVA